MIGHDPWKSWRHCPGGCSQPIDSGCRERPCQARSSVVSGGVCSQSASRPAVVSAEQSLLPRLCRLLCLSPSLALCPLDILFIHPFDQPAGPTWRRGCRKMGLRVPPEAGFPRLLPLPLLSMLCQILAWFTAHQMPSRLIMFLFK